MAAPTVVQLIEAALNELGEYEAGETLAPEDTALALTIFNDFIDALNADSSVVHLIDRITWPLVPNTTYYLVGPANVSVPVTVTARPDGPADIHGIGFINNAVVPLTEMGVGLPLTEQAYMGLPNKTLTAPYPQYWYYAASLPNGSLFPWPIPTMPNLTGVLYCNRRMAEFAALTDLVTMPYGYRKWFRKALAIELAPAFGAQVSPELTKSAAMAEMIAKRPNRRPMDMSIEAAAMGTLGRSGARYNIFTDK